VAAVEAAQEQNAIAVARLAILRVRAPRHLAVDLALRIAVEEVVVEVVEADTAVSAVGITKRRATRAEG